LSKIVITISGTAGTGKSTEAKLHSKKFGLRYVSADSIFRKMAEEKGMSLEQFSKFVEEHPEIDKEIDERTIEEAKKGNVIIEGRLAAWFTRDFESFDIRLCCPLDIVVERIAKRENIPIEVARAETIAREESAKKRYKELYGIDISDLSIYDLVLNTALFDIEATARILETAIREYINAISGKNKQPHSKC